jgi:fatty acyl-CoA reductase
MSVSKRKRIPNDLGNHRRVAFYDLDGTLADLNLVHVAIFMLSNVGEWTGRAAYMLSFAARIPRLYLAEQRDRRLLNTVLFEAFKGISRDRLFSLGEEYCERILIGRLFPRAVEMIEANRAEGIEPVLVTGSPDFVVAPLSRHLKIEEFAANRFIYSRGLATGRLAAPVMAGDDKAAWCAEWAAERGVDLADCWGYADSHYDMAFLAALGHPVAVNPDRRLRAAATSRQWPIIHFEKNIDSENSQTSVSDEFPSEVAVRGSNGAS